LVNTDSFRAIYNRCCSNRLVLNAERLRRLMNEQGLSQSELARRVGLSQTSIYNLVSGKAYGSAHLHRIASALGTTAAYLDGETDDPEEGAPLAPTPKVIAQHLDLVEIPQIDMAYGMGVTFADGHVDVDMLHFPRTWIEAITSSPPSLLTWASGRGDSMAPTIHDGDLVLLDRSQRRVVEQDALWAYTVGDFGAIKRLRMKGNRVVILSDNPSVPPDEELADEVNIVARVIFIGRRT
jgi:phage repressor protein C with HTH and peptisase S24 domain